MAKKILIVDDSLFIRKVLNDLLSDDYEVIEANSCDNAIEQYTKERPDLVLLDIIMPGGEEEGIRALEEIKQINSQAIVIMITAVGQDAVIQECKEIGASDYVVKPFDAEQVMEIVTKYLDK